MTRRVLLLLESRSLARRDVHVRVVRGILRRYIDSERSFLAEVGRRYKVPRFFLNDVIRYWRTVAVDYVSKRWERGDEGWALRNVKLRFSRKLMFVSGLLLCFSPYLEEPAEAEHTLFKDQEEAAQKVHGHIAARLGEPPLDVLCHAFATLGAEDAARKVLLAYDAFLSALNDSEKRKRLATLSPEESYSDTVFNQLRQQSHNFQEGLDTLFYESNEGLRALIRRYGVF